MNPSDFSKLLLRLCACSGAREYAEGQSLADVWNKCERADWLLWLCGRMAGENGWPTQKEVVLAACACAETALKHVPSGEERPRRCIEMVRAWANGLASIEDVRAARSAAYAAASAASADAASAASAYAAYAAADAYAARKKTLGELANLVREMLNVPSGATSEK
jgi:hypothetical protein